MAARALIAIHGVGAPRAGEILDELLSVPRASVSLPLYMRTDLASKGRTIPCAQATGPAPFETIVELNWTDVGRPVGGVIGAVRHLFLVVLAMLHAQPGRPGRVDAQSLPQRAYRLCFEAVFVWCVWPVLTTLLVNEALMRPTSADAGRVLGIMLAVSVAVVVATLAYLFGRYGGALRAGYLWAVISLAVGFLQVGTTADGGVITAAALMYALGQFTTIALLGLLGVHAVFAGWRIGATRDQITARVALGHAPLVMMAIGGAVLWAAALSVTSESARVAWAPHFLRGLRYDLRRVEQYATLVIAIVPILIAFVAAMDYSQQRRHGGQGGLTIRNWLSRAVLAIPLVLSIPGALLMYGVVFGAVPADQADVLAVYATSALRVVPWLGMSLIPPLRVLFDVLGDVAFFVVPLDSRLSARAETTARFRELLEQFRGRPITVAAYSQGTVIALEELRKDDDVTLITVGAPLQSLYKRFLGFDLGAPRAHRTWRWTNLWRRGDYIGGPIADADSDSSLKVDGGHLAYFCDAEVWEVLIRGTDDVGAKEAPADASGQTGASRRLK